jgi:uncharacterized protein YecT (DUF1311 family)
MKYAVAVIVALLVVCVGAFYQGERWSVHDETKVVDNFYQHVISLDVRGAPSRETVDSLSPFISSKLREALLQAWVDEEAHTRETKGEEAPLFEGPMFLGVWEGAQKVLDVQRDHKSEPTSYVVTLQMKSPYDKDPKNNWKDRVILVQENGKWVVDDLVFRVDTNPPSVRSLMHNLQQISEDCVEPISQADMNRCAGQNQTREETRLKSKLQQMAANLEPAARQRFEAAQQAWQSYRLKQCSFEVASYEGGSMAPMVYATCMADLAQQRNKDLLAILNEPR